MARVNVLATWQARVDRALGALERGAGVGRAAREGKLDRRLVGVVAAARPGDARAVLGALGGVSAEVTSLERSLVTTLYWPAVVLVLSFASSAVLLRVALPALERLPFGGARVSVTPWLFGLAALAGALVALVFLAKRRWALGGALSVWRSLDAWGFVACLAALVRAGEPLPSAVRAAASWVSPTLRAFPEAFARELEAGRPQASAVAPLLGEVQAGVLAAAASAGTVDVALEALVSLAAATARREAPRDALRLQAAALLLAGAAVGVVGVAFYVTYLHAVTG